MGATLDLYIDTSSGQLLDGGSVVGGALPTLTRNDSYTLRLRLLEKNPNGTYDDIDFTGASLKTGIGNIEEPPSSGSFKLAINGVTSSEIPYNATAVCVYNAVSNNVSTVALYGADLYGSYLLTASQPNTAMSFGSDAFTLFPASSVLVSTRKYPASSVNAQQVVKLVRNPIVYADTFTATPTSGEIALTKLQDGGTNANETYELSVGPLVRGGLFSLSFGGNSTTGIAPFTSAVSVQTAISQGISSITSNISVQENGESGYIIQFTGRLAQTNVTTDLLLDSSGINFLPLRQTTLTINTAEVEDAFADSGEDTITPTLEVELTQNGSPKTIYQGSVTIRKDLITAGSSVPGAQASYYTKAEADSLFVEDSTSNVDAANRKLKNSEGDTVINYGTGQISDATGTCLGFFGATPIQRPTQTNVISNVVSLGLIADSTTYGVLPGSIKTITTSVTLTFGTVAANDTTSVSTTITGSNINDIVLLGLPNSLCAGLSFYGHVTTANVVELDAVNGINSSRTQSDQTYRIAVIGY